MLKTTGQEEGWIVLSCAHLFGKWTDGTGIRFGAERSILLRYEMLM